MQAHYAACQEPEPINNADNFRSGNYVKCNICLQIRRP